MRHSATSSVRDAVLFEILHKISVTCFFASYVVALVLEMSRLVGNFGFRKPAVLAMMGLGIFTHVSYLFLRAVYPAVEDDRGLLSSWGRWSLFLALGLAVIFVIAYLRQSTPSSVSFFCL